MTTTLTIPTLETDRLTLRAPKLSDHKAYADFRGDAERTKYLGGPYSSVQAFDQLGEIIGHWHLRGYGRFMVADKATDAPLGVIGPFFPPDWPEPEIAWSVFAAAEGRGIALEAARAARAFAYDTLGWTTAISMITDGNDRSSKLADRMGCLREADYAHPQIGAMQVWRHPSPEALT